MLKDYDAYYRWLAGREDTDERQDLWAMCEQIDTTRQETLGSPEPLTRLDANGRPLPTPKRPILH